MGAALREQGHQVRLILAQFVKPYRKSNKNDFIARQVLSATLNGDCYLQRNAGTSSRLVKHRLGRHGRKDT
jgi:transposase